MPASIPESKQLFSRSVWNSEFVFLGNSRFHISSLDHITDSFFRTIGSLNCGYAKLQEARRMMAFYRQSGKKIIGYCSGGAEKELYFSLGNFP